MSVRPSSHADAHTPDAVSRRAAAALDDLRRDLPAVAADHVLAVLGGIAIGLDEYLATRIVELVVHADDLVASVDGLQPPALPAAAEATTTRVLAEVARRRTSTRAMLTTLARRERAPPAGTARLLIPAGTIDPLHGVVAAASWHAVTAPRRTSWPSSTSAAPTSTPPATLVST